MIDPSGSNTSKYHELDGGTPLALGASREGAEGKYRYLIAIEERGCMIRHSLLLNPTKIAGAATRMTALDRE